MSCDRFRDWILDDLLGELDEWRRVELESHLAGCEGCRRESEAWSTIWADLGAVAANEPSSYGLDRLRQRIREEHTESPEPEFAAGRFAGWQVAALLLVTLGLGGWLGWLTASRTAERPETAVSAGQRYVMIFSSTQEPPEETEKMRQEMGAWYRGLKDQGVIESFIGIAEDPAVGSPDARDLMANDVSGLIVFRAADAEEARRIAASAPALAYGAEVEVRLLY